jgi:hypothetical protein
MHTMMTERRRSPRFPLVLVTVVEHLDRPRTTLNGLTADVSTCGCFIDVVNPMLVETSSGSATHQEFSGSLHGPWCWICTGGGCDKLHTLRMVVESD